MERVSLTIQMDHEQPDKHKGSGAPLQARAARCTGPDVVRAPVLKTTKCVPGQSEGRPVLSLMLAIALAVVVFIAVQSMGGIVPQVVTIGLSMLSLAGLIALFGALAGFVHFRAHTTAKGIFRQVA
jgi:hypothetical protein